MCVHVWIWVCSPSLAVKFKRKKDISSLLAVNADPNTLYIISVSLQTDKNKQTRKKRLLNCCVRLRGPAIMSSECCIFTGTLSLLVAVQMMWFQICEFKIIKSFV